MEKQHLAYCSYCLKQTFQFESQSNIFSRNEYRCGDCGNVGVQCRFCENLAKKGGIIFDDHCCAEHDGSIASFARLNIKLNDIAKFESIFERDSINVAKAAKIGAGVIAGGAVFAPLALIAAPGFAAALGSAGLLGAAGTGTAIVELSGAALTSASLAALGGGTMAAGAAVVTATGAALGAWKGGQISNSYFGDVDGFHIRKIHTGSKKDKHAVIFVNGFLSESDHNVDDWTDHLDEHFSSSYWYHVDWEASNLKKLGKLLSKSPEIYGSQMAKELTMRAAKEGAKRVGIFSTVLSAVDVLKNPWHESMVKAAMTGVLLADAIARTPGWTFTLAGHSLGARVIFYALEALSTKTEEPVIDDVYLLGGAVGGGEKDSKGWESAARAVSGKINNCFSKRDLVLQYLYQGANGFLSKPIGYEPIVLRNRKILDFDFTNEISGHMEWKSRFGSIYKQINGVT